MNIITGKIIAYPRPYFIPVPIFILDTILKNFDENSTLLIATHLISEIENICDEVIFLAYGEIVLQGNVDDIKAEKNKSIDAIFREEFRC